MNDVANSELVRPQEVSKPTEVAEKKGPSITAKFQKAKAGFNSLAGGIKQAFTKIAAGSHGIIFDAEQHELNQLSQGLDQLNRRASTALGITPEQARMTGNESQPDSSNLTLDENTNNKESETPAVKLEEEIKALEQQLALIRNEHPLPNDFRNSFIKRREVISTLEKQGILPEISKKAFGRIVQETDFFKPIEDVGLKMDLKDKTIQFSAKDTSIKYNTHVPQAEGDFTGGSIRFSGKSEIRSVKAPTTAEDVYVTLLSPNYVGIYPGSIGDITHEATHLLEYQQRLPLFKEKPASHWQQHRGAMNEALAYRFANMTYSRPGADMENDESASQPLWKVIGTEYASKVPNVSLTEWKTAFQTIDNMLALGFSVREIASFMAQDCEYTETTLENGQVKGSFPSLENVINSRLRENSLTRGDLPQVRRRFSLRRQIETQKASSICRQEFLNATNPNKESK